MNVSNDCAWVGEVLPDFLAGRVSAEDHERVRAHLAECADCRNRSNAVSLLQQTPVPRPDPHRWDHFVQGVVEAASQERQKRLPRFVWGAAAAAAALILVGAGLFTWDRFGRRDDREELSIEVLAREVAQLPPMEAAVWTVGVDPGHLIPMGLDLGELTEEQVERLVKEVERT